MNPRSPSPQDFAHARQLFSACLELVTEFSPKLRQVMLNEMLLLEVRAHEAAAAEGCKERPPPDLVSRVRGYLEMRIHGESGTPFAPPAARDFLVLKAFQRGLHLRCTVTLFSSVPRSAAAPGGGRGVRRLHVELEGERLPDAAGAAVAGHEQPVHQGTGGLHHADVYCNVATVEAGSSH